MFSGHEVTKWYARDEHEEDRRREEPPVVADEPAQQAETREHRVDRSRDAAAADAREQVRPDVRGDVEILGEDVSLGWRRVVLTTCTVLRCPQRTGSGQCLRSFSQLRCNGSGSTRASATVVMKLVSPFHRGTTWTCTCPGMPAPPARPMLTPTLAPSGWNAPSTATVASCVIAMSAFASSVDSPESVPS